MAELKPNVIEQIERYSLDRDKIEELIKAGFMSEVFLGGRAGEGQRVEFGFDLGHNPTGTVTIKTLVQPYTDNPK